MSYDFTFDRTVVIRARRATVFRFFTDTERFARWWGAGSTIDPVVGGAVRIVYPGGAEAHGEIRELVTNERIAFTYGYPDASKPIPAGGSLVVITFADDRDGTRVELVHHVATAEIRDQHVQGWKYQLALYAKVAADDEHAGIATVTAAWFAAWNDPARARGLLEQIAIPDIEFRDGFGCSRGLDELAGHVAACHRFMPGVRIDAQPPRQAHGVALADWVMVKPDGSVLGRGTNVFRLAPDGTIAEVVGV
jgi:uncharacterized protein YndB with AHSA1/START domain